MYEQLTLTDYLKSQIELKNVMGLTEWINSQGKAQFTQVRDLVREYIPDNDDLFDSLTNAVSVYILRQSLGYMKYLSEEAKNG
jgi:hypothetical protein